MALIPVFKPGTHTAVDGRKITFTLENCIDLAESYDPSLSEAPAVIGHPKLTAPAYGWAKTFQIKDGLVYAELDQVNPEFAEAFNSGAYKKRSLSIYLPESPGNPKPGHYYARHIGFLGAAAPAIKGLPDASFAESDGELGAAEFAMPFNEDFLLMFSNLREYLIEKDGIEKADQLLPKWQLEYLAEQVAQNRKENEMPQPNNIDFAEQQAKIDAKNADLAAREQALLEKEQKNQRAEFAAFVDELVKDGKLLPAHKTTVVEVFMALGSDPISFAEGDATVNSSPVDLIKKVLSERPAFMNFAEKSAAEDEENKVDIQDPKAIAEAAAQYQKEQADKGNTISISQAVTHVTKAKK
ncbi:MULTISPECIES: hypothetical protein [unclassified Gilliamella]|uniref:hypothetical protein n=1 Tax=unclassified Gilliamella TaxID=2685620 RepID=UPI0018DE76B2|nr:MULTISPECIES: hypothetical protein [unclassified Gilliamella]MBI0114213.1 peptidase [Gilliamella sp. W8123]MBI0117750.1 peptidase [Gilliamella sp. W8129]